MKFSSSVAMAALLVAFSGSSVFATDVVPTQSATPCATVIKVVHHHKKHKKVSPVVAQSAPVVSTQPQLQPTDVQTVPVRYFDGFNVGVDITVTSLNDLHSGFSSVKTIASDLQYAGTIGYGIQTDSDNYFGGDVELGSTQGIDRHNGVKDTSDYTVGVDAKVGHVFDQTTLVYSRVGYALKDLKETNTSTHSNGSGTFNGVRAGVGLDHMVSENVSLRTEVLYTDYETKKIGTATVDPSDLALRVGASYHF